MSVVGWVLGTLAGLVVLLWPGRRRPPDDDVPGGQRVDRQAHGRDGGGVQAGRPKTGLRRWSRGPSASPGQVASVAEVADALVLIALALRAGLDLTHALDEVVTGARGPVARDLSAVVAAVRWGRPVDEAWTYAGTVWRPAAMAWSVADATGAAPAALVADAAVRLREGQERDRERRAARAGVLLVLPLGLGFLPAFACTAVLPVVIALALGVLDAAG
jgi:hypothetical protein